MELTEWDTPPEDTPVSTKEIDLVLQDYAEARVDYEEKKKESTDAYDKSEELKAQALELLEKAGKSKWSLDGVGSFSIRRREVTKFPKDVDNRQKVLEWLRDRHGDRFLFSNVTINYNKFNSIINEELENSDDPGFQIPGVETGVEEVNLSFRKARN